MLIVICKTTLTPKSLRLHRSNHITSLCRVRLLLLSMLVAPINDRVPPLGVIRAFTLKCVPFLMKALNIATFIPPILLVAVSSTLANATQDSSMSTHILV